MNTNQTIKVVIFCMLLFVAPCCFVSAQDQPLTIGSDAPHLEIEHWLSDGDGKFDRVQQFEPGRVYVIEFWATWCGPCLVGMPKISELQSRYVDQGVQIVSVSSETLDTVNQLLARKLPGSEKTYGSVSGNYSVTCDPDGSVKESYMGAAGQTKLPVAFIVGKDAKVEWIGNPTDLEQPLDQIVNNSWNRESFAAEFQMTQLIERKMQQAVRLLQAGETEKGLQMVDELLAQLPQSRKTEIQVMKFSFLLSRQDPRAVETFRELVEGNKEDAELLNRFVVGIIELSMEGDTLDADLIAAARQAADWAAKAMPEAHILDSQAHVAELQGKLEEAIAIQKRAVEAADDELSGPLSMYLKELERKQDKLANPPDTDSKDDDDDGDGGRS